MAKKAKQKSEVQLTKSDEIAINVLMEQGKKAVEIAIELDISIELVNNYVERKLLQLEKSNKPPLPFAIKKHGDSSFVQMTHAASEISDAAGPMNRSGYYRNQDCIFRPEKKDG